MKKVITIRDVKIGEGTPKICVSLIGETLQQLLEEAVFLNTLDIDIVEWRVDFFEKVENLQEVKNALAVIREILSDKPLIFTFRSKKEGGEKEISTEFYFELNKAILETDMADLIDIELFNEEQRIKEMVEVARDYGVKVIISNHEFTMTPTKEEIILRLRKAQRLGGDIPKIAVMPASAADVLILLEATDTMNEKYADGPIVTISMGNKGVISRCAGELFGSAITFASAKKASAPGQIDVKDLRTILNLLHTNL